MSKRHTKRSGRYGLSGSVKALALSVRLTPGKFAHATKANSVFDQSVAQVDDLWDAIIVSAVKRFRPIMLTTLAAILGMIPLTRSTFWGPMAWAIMGGLFIATLLTLLFLPGALCECLRRQEVANADRCDCGPSRDG